MVMMSTNRTADMVAVGATMAIKPPPSPDRLDSEVVVVTFFDCSFANGQTEDKAGFGLMSMNHG